MSRRTEARNLDLDLEQRENEAMQSQDDSTDTEHEASTPRGSKTSSVSRKSPGISVIIQAPEYHKCAHGQPV